LDRYREEKLGALTGRALDPDPSAVRLDDPLRNRQPQPGATLVGSASRLPIPIEDARLIGEGNSRSRIGDEENDAAAPRFGADGDAAAVRGDPQRGIQTASAELHD